MLRILRAQQFVQPPGDIGMNFQVRSARVLVQLDPQGPAINVHPPARVASSNDAKHAVGARVRLDLTLGQLGNDLPKV